MKTILVIEDNPTLKESIQELLEAEGFRTLAAADGLQGIQLARAHQPDLILCDVQMPGINGYDVLETLHKDTSTAIIPFIFLTAKDSRADLRLGMELGADDYLTKPFQPQELLGAIAKRLEKQAVIRAQAQQQLDSLRSSISLLLPHELRTPIASILSSVELLRLLAESGKQQEILEIADAIQISTERLHRLIKNFLLYAELEIALRDPARLKGFQGGMTPNPQALITRAAAECARQFNRKADLTLKLQNATIAFQDIHFKKVVEELIENAFKFSDMGTPVQVISLVHAERFVVEIADQGRGLTAAQITSLGAYMQFDRQFYEQQGVGLGLIIAKRLVESGGGSLAIVSTPRQRTVVRATFPIVNSNS